MNTEDFKKKLQNVDKESIVEFCKKNSKVLIGAVAVLVFAIILIVVGVHNGSSDNRTGFSKSDEYEVDKNEEIVKLMKDYYTSYAAGDVETMKKTVTPISEFEQSYIVMFSQYVESYQDIKCYVMDGMDKNSYIVSVTSNMKFPNIETMVPSLETFYLRTNDDGKLYIDNLYSTFNYVATNEKEVDANVSDYIKEYEKQDDFIKLAEEIEKKSQEALAADPTLSEYINSLNNTVIPQWLSAYKAEQQAKAEAEAAAKAAEEEAARQQAEAEAAAKAAEEQAAQEAAQQQAALQNAETVYTTTKTNMRDAASTSGNILATVEFGTPLSRTGVQDDWSIVIYNGTTGYIKSEYLSTEVPQQDVSTAVYSEGQTVTFNTTANIRSSMSETSSKVTVAAAGDKATVVMCYAEGWTKVNYKNKTGYVKTELLQ